MNTRQRIALAWPPLFLRLGLAIAFIWAGYGKIFTNATVDANQAATLANMGVSISTVMPSPQGPKPDIEKPPVPAGPDKPLPPSDPEKSGPATGKAGGSKAPSKPPKTAQASAEGSPLLGAAPPVAARTQATPAVPPGIHTPDQFPEQNSVRSVYRISLLLVSAAVPKGDSGKPTALWPAALTTGKWPIWLAWAVAFSEFGGGILVLIGLLTRLAAASLAGVMIGAMWLTQIGPAVQSGKTMLGFLPAHPLTDIAAWMPVQWQMSLLMMSCALFFAGAGIVAIDNFLFAPSPSGRKPSPPAPKPA